MADSCFELGRAADEQFADLGISVGRDPHAGTGDRDACDDASIGAADGRADGDQAGLDLLDGDAVAALARGLQVADEVRADGQGLAGQPDQRQQEQRLNGKTHQKQLDQRDARPKKFGKRIPKGCQYAKAEHQEDAQEGTVWFHRKRSPRPIDVFSLGRLTLFGMVRLCARQGVPGELISEGVATA